MGSRKRPRELLAEIESKLSRRNKLIKIADTSAGGWGTVEQHERTQLGSDSEDEKKIRAAERRALASKREREVASKKPSGAYKPTYRKTSPYSKAKATDVCLRCNQVGH